MSKFKKIFVNILAGLLCVLSLGVMTSCIDIPGVTVSDEEINVYRDGVDAYVYNGERYIYPGEKSDFLYVIDWIEINWIGTAYDSIGRKYGVAVSSKSTEKNVLVFSNEFYFDFFSRDFYIKESMNLSSNPLDAEYSSIAVELNFEKKREEVEVSNFKLRDVLATETIPQDSLSKQKARKLIYCGVSNMHPIYQEFIAYLDYQNKIYIMGSKYGIGTSGREIIDEEIKDAIMQLCFPEYA